MDFMSFPVCDQCGFTHPPIRNGEKCPMAKQKDNSGNEIDFRSFFASLQNILISQIQQKDIKDPKKFLGHILIKITTFSEDYGEWKLKQYMKK